MASWRIVIEGDGPIPTGTIHKVEVAAPPLPPKLPDPPGDQPHSTDPFDWPADPFGDRYDPAERYSNLGRDPATGADVYAAMGEFRNPLPGSHKFAGRLPALAWAKVPAHSPLFVHKATAPQTIRRLLATGRVRG